MSNVPAVQTAQPVERFEGDDGYRRQMARLRHEAGVLASSRLVRKDLQGKPEDVFAIAITARTMGIPLNIQTLNQFAVINGVAVPMGQLLIGMAARAGHEIWIEERSPEQATVVLRNGRSRREHRVTYTMAEAAPTTKGNEVWTKYPADMLVWRAVRRAVRIGAPEIAAGFGSEFVAEEPAPYIDPLAEPPRRYVVREWTYPPGGLTGWGVWDNVDGTFTGGWFGQHVKMAAEQVADLLEANTEGGWPESAGAASTAASAPTVETRPGDGPGHGPWPSAGTVSGSEPARPLAQQIAIQAQRAGVDRHHVIAAVTAGAKTSAKEVDPEEGELVLLAIADIAAGKLEVVPHGESWKFRTIEKAPPDDDPGWVDPEQAGFFDS